MRLYGQYSIQEHSDLFATAGYSERQDDSQFSRSLVTSYGKDRTVDVAFGVNWRFAPSWSMRAQGARFENRSNISLYGYTRDEWTVSVRRDFK